jgi:lipid A ethanolaminephosphotransferase
LADEIRESDKDKLLIVLHCSTSHGPKYFDKYPPEFNRFTPVCTNVEISSADKEGLVNAYDNTILYTDYLVHSVIETLRQLDDRRCCMIYVSDHGESLGENDMFMHGTLPRNYAPKQQYEIPFIVWENDSATKTKELESVRQFYVFHSVMNWFGMQSPVYNEEMNVFEPVD